MAAPMRQDAAPDQRPRYSAGRLSGMLQCHKMAAIDARKALRGRANLQEPNCSTPQPERAIKDLRFVFWN